MATPVAVGVDNGGTWIRLIGLDARGRVLWSFKKHSPTVKQLPAFLKKNLRRFHGDLSFLGVGSRGVWKKAKRQDVKRALHGLAKKIVVMSDVEAAWLAAFKREGIIVISGTGSIAYGRRADGTFARAGGLGPEKGDEGSGYWIGKKWLEKRKARREKRRTSGDRKNSVRDIAQSAPYVILQAKLNNPEAVCIIREAQSQLAALVVQVIKTLRLKRDIPLSVNGSVFGNRWFKRGFLKELRKKHVSFCLTSTEPDVAGSLAFSLFASRSSLFPLHQSIMSHAAD